MEDSNLLNLFSVCFVKPANLQELFINASTLSKQINNTARTKIYCKLNGRQQIVRQHTTSGEKKQYFDGTIFRYYFMNLMAKLPRFL